MTGGSILSVCLGYTIKPLYTDTRYKDKIPYNDDLNPTGEKEVVGSTPAEVGNILSWR